MNPEPLERDLVKCEDMRLHAERAVQYLGSRSLEEFLADDLTQAAVMRCIEVIGEAARLVSENTRREAREIPWQLIVGMRHILAHDYGTVNLDKIYAVVKGNLPVLIKELKVLIASLEKETHWNE